ncbi:GTP-binding protein [Chitinimonas sp.]|uniref:CobW family GTP-binding protein n=1 Tax=Chitinimonas sp. TaxID=1934313 RepID=UPI0035B41C41
MASNPRLAGMKRVPVNLITGFLGVGKTTAVRHLLASKPASEYWAVLVNEFGEVGIDGAVIEAMREEALATLSPTPHPPAGAGELPGRPRGETLKVVEVPGGCICCTTSPMLRVSLTRLLRERRPDRLLIEPSGLGHPAGIVDVLRDPYLAAALELRAIITLVDPRQLDDSRYSFNETWRDQIALADVLVANKCDRADAAQVDRFNAMAAGLYPPKQAWITTCQGELPLDLLDVASERLAPHSPPSRPTMPSRKVPATGPVEEPALPASMLAPGKAAAVRDNQVGDQSSRGWIWAPEQRFSADRLAALFQRLHDHASLNLPPIARAKGVFHTDHGWLLFNWVSGEASAVEIAWRRDCRAELIISGGAADWSTLEAAWASCLIDSA